MDKLIPVVVIKELGETEKILTALDRSGIHCAEITFRTACAEEAIALASEKFPQMNIGAGTVINLKPAGFLIDDGKGCRIVKITDDPLDGVIEKAGELLEKLTKRNEED